ncbi:MAG TPA: class I SAM-dependent methyltransferase [Pyrinomonadaceae bacterium]|nr:class I SAM-dependent methyltransferase [Pyrinomonadaceae bacterium]
MFQPSLSIAERPASFEREAVASFTPDSVGPRRLLFTDGLQRRWRRERRRRKVGRAFDMALEIARIVPANSRLLDVGCGNGFIAHHLSAMLGAKALGIDLGATTEAGIDYRQFNGKHFPVEDKSVDSVLLCYVLHHAQDIGTVLKELRRVLRASGLAVIYEDIPSCWWDRLVCWTHDLKWRKRTGRCTFRAEREWRTVFNSAGFEIVSEQALSRWRNLAHPVRRRLYVLKATEAEAGQA